MRLVFEKRKTLSRKALFLVPLVSFLISVPYLGGLPIFCE